MTRRLIQCALVTLTLTATSFASTITNVTIKGLFNSPTDDTPGVQVGDPAVTPAGAAAVTRVSWGVPPGVGNPQSSYVFSAINQPSLPNIGGPIPVNPPAVTPYFVLGSFTHNNFVVDNPYLTSVKLDVILSFDVDGVNTGPHTFTFLFNHTETPNVIEKAIPVCPFLTTVGEECTDRVVLNGTAPQNIVIGGVTFTLDLSLQVGGSPVSQFITREGFANTADVVARFSSASTPGIPEPATVAMLGSALLLIGARRWRSKQ